MFVCMCLVACKEKMHKYEKSVVLQASLLLLRGDLGLISCVRHCELESVRSRDSFL